MILISAEASKFNIKLSETFSYFTAQLKHLPYVLITLESDLGLKGYGEAALAWDMTGETQSGALDIFKIIKPILLNGKIEDIKDVLHIMRNIREVVFGNTALKSGIEAALLDLLGKLKRKPVYKLFKASEKKYVTLQKTFSFEDERNGKLKQELAGSKADPVCKFKIGRDEKKDLELVKKVFALKPEAKIVLDVNQGWGNFEKALSIMKKLEKFQNVLWIEQPVPADDYDGLVEIKKKSKIHVMVDESCHNLLDLKNLFHQKALDLVNIKLAKCGGIFEALKMIDFCKKYKIRYMLGDMIHSSLGTAANLHLAALEDFITFDLTPSSRVIGDSFSGLHFEGDRIFIPQNPGLGVNLK